MRRLKTTNPRNYDPARDVLQGHVTTDAPREVTPLVLSEATTQNAGLLSASDKLKIDNLNDDPITEVVIDGGIL